MDDNNKIVYVGFSDGGLEGGTHYVCMWDEREEATKRWCERVKEKYPDNHITYLKMTENTMQKLQQSYRDEYFKSK